MDLGTKFLMGAYITVAVFLSVIPFSIYMYLICKKSKFGRRIKRSINKCRGKELVDDDGNSYVDVLRWPYPSRETEEGISNSVFMINLPSYDEVMKNKELYNITSDIKVFYSINRSVNNELDTGITFSNELQGDSATPTNNSETDSEQSNTQSDSLQLGDSQTDSMQPIHPETDSLQPNHTQTESSQPNHPETDSLQPSHTQTDSSQPNHTQTDSS